MKNSLKKFSQYKVSGKEAQGGRCDGGSWAVCSQWFPTWILQQYHCNSCPW